MYSPDTARVISKARETMGNPYAKPTASPDNEAYVDLHRCRLGETVQDKAKQAREMKP